MAMCINPNQRDLCTEDLLIHLKENFLSANPALNRPQRHPLQHARQNQPTSAEAVWVVINSEQTGAII
jgi:hypothetical protein